MSFLFLISQHPLGNSVASDWKVARVRADIWHTSSLKATIEGAKVMLLTLKFQMPALAQPYLPSAFTVFHNPTNFV